MQLKRIKGMTAKVARELFTATVTPTVDYASPVWSTNLPARSKSTINQVQRIGMQPITGAFRVVALTRAEMEAGIESMEARLQGQQNKFWIKSHTLPQKHPF